MTALASDLLETFSTSPLKPLNGIQRNLTGSKTFSTKFVFSGRLEKQDGRPGQSAIKKVYSGARYVALLAACSYKFSVVKMCINNLKIRSECTI